MKMFNYFLGFNAFALAYWVFDTILCSLDTEVNYYIVSCLIFSALGAVAVYNIYEGYKKQKYDSWY